MKYALITVTRGGNVSVAPCDSLAMCQQAKSIALTGRTIEENEELAAAKKRRDEEWHAAHPPRKPTPEEARQIAAGVIVISSGGNSWRSTADGMVQDLPPSDGMVYVTNGSDDANEIKFAKCVGIVED